MGIFGTLMLKPYKSYHKFLETEFFRITSRLQSSLFEKIESIFCKFEKLSPIRTNARMLLLFCFKIFFPTVSFLKLAKVC